MQGVPASDGVTDPPMTISSGNSLTSPRAPLSHAPIPMSKAMESRRATSSAAVWATSPSGSLQGPRSHSLLHEPILQG